MRRFIAHWRPDIALIAESELWPNFLVEADRANTPIVLVNARLSERSYRRWRRLSGFIGALLGRIDLCLAQSEGDGERFALLGAPDLDHAIKKREPSPKHHEIGQARRARPRQHRPDAQRTPQAA